MKNYRSTVIGFAVLVVLLSAGAAQSLAGSNTVTSDDIVDFSIVANDIKTAAIGGRPIVDNSITGADVNEATLALTCPSGMGRVSDICYTAERTDDWFTANESCAQAGLRLPTISEASVMGNKNGFNSMWTNALHYINSTTLYAIVTRGTGGYQSVTVSFSVETTFRCVTTVGARP